MYRGRKRPADGPGQAGSADMEWGRDVAVHSAEMLCVGVAKFLVVKFEFAEICPEIVSRKRANGGSMSRRDLLRSFQRHVKAGRDIDGALNHLIQSEQIPEPTSHRRAEECRSLTGWWSGQWIALTEYDALSIAGSACSVT